MSQLAVIPLLTVFSLLAMAAPGFPAAAGAGEAVQLQLAVRGVAAYPAYIAKHLGYFEDEKVDVEVVSGTCHHVPHVCRASTNLVQQVSAGTVLIGWGVPAAVLPAVARGERLKFFYTYGVKSFFDLVVPEDSTVTTVGDLRGKTVGITDLGYGEVPFVRTVLATAGLRSGENVTTMPVGRTPAAMLASFRDERIQALGGSAEELAWLYHTGFKARSLSGDYRELPSSGIFVTEKTFTERRKLLVKVARSVARATLFSMTNPRAAEGLLAKIIPQQFQNVEVGRVLFHTYLDLSTPLRTDKHGEPLFGYAMPEGWERLHKILLSGEKPVLGRPVDLVPIVAGELISEINRFDRGKVRQQARAFKP